MSLEIDKIAPQVEDLAREISLEREEQSKALKLAWGTFLKLGPEQEELKKRLEAARTTFLVAEPLQDLGSFPLCNTPPRDYSVIAVDGSNLSSERYSPLPYFMINLGVAILSYGAAPDAKLFSTPRLYFKPEDIVVRDPSGKECDVLIKGALLGVRRQVEEAACLASIVTDLEPGERPVLALLDGSLVLWGLEDQTFGAFVHHAMLDEGLLKALGKVKLHSSNQIAMASYISTPGSNEVVNLLRLHLCPREPVNCDRFCREKAQGSRECDVLSGVGDNALFLSLLKPGQRSPVFGSRSSVMKYYGENRVCFFYVRLEDEVARVEVPEWMTRTENLIALTHSMVYDQCLRGAGYPVALSESHELAVLRGEDRRLFNSMLEQLCLEKDLQLALNAKDSSKRSRWI